MNAISIIVPTLNEADNVGMLIERIADTFEPTQTKFEILFVDDHSSDGTRDVINSYAEKYPVQVQLKVGPRGKAYSLLEGFNAAHYDTLCMIDADLQYPPEAIVPMHQLMLASDTDIVLTNRQEHNTSAVRKVTSAGFNLVFTKLMFGFDYDSQSGLKLFKREVIENIKLDPTPWSFDLEFIVRSLEKNYKIVSYDINFAERYAGDAKIQVGKVAYELAKASVKLRLNSSPAKVKSAYKESNQIAKRTVLVSTVAAAYIAAVFLISPLSTQAIDLVAVREANLTNIQLAHFDQDKLEKPASSTPAPTTPPILAPTPTPPAPTVPTPTPTTTPSPTTTPPATPAPTVKPVTAPPTPTTPTPTPTPSTTAKPDTPTTQPTVPAPRQTAAQPAVTRSAQQPTFPAASGTTSTGTERSYTPTTEVSAGNVLAANTADQATYPDGTKKTGGFSYTAEKPTANAGLAKPLSISAFIIVLASISAYLILTRTRNIKLSNNQQAIEG